MFRAWSSLLFQQFCSPLSDRCHIWNIINKMFRSRNYSSVILIMELRDDGNKNWKPKQFKYKTKYQLETVQKLDESERYFLWLIQRARTGLIRFRIGYCDLRIYLSLEPLLKLWTIFIGLVVSAVWNGGGKKSGVEAVRWWFPLL